MTRNATLSLILAGMTVGCGPTQKTSSPPPPAPAETKAPPVEAAAPGIAGDPAWVPAKFMGKLKGWKDCGVYVDGVPMGFLAYAELPRGLEPVWDEEVEKLPFKPGEERKTRIRRIPRYRLADYLTAVGVDIRQIKTVQLLGGQRFVAEISGPQFRKYKEGVGFRFGGVLDGKALPIIPDGVKTNTSFDKLRAVTIYINKPAPQVTDIDTLELDGKAIDDVVAYHGTPLRGGVHIYKDGKLAYFLKRNKLTDVKALIRGKEKTGNRYQLTELLTAKGVDLSDVVEAELINNDQYLARWDRAQLDTASAVMADQAKGRMLLSQPVAEGSTAEPVSTKAVMLYTKAASKPLGGPITEEKLAVVGG